MKKLLIAIISIIMLSTNLLSQSSINNILTEIEKNNTSLLALRKKAEAEKIGNKTQIYLQSPEFEFNYLSSNPSETGNRTDLSISQSFDFPTAYLYENQISNIKNEQVDIEYQKQLRSLLLKTRLVCNDIVYTNALMSKMSNRIIHAKDIANSFQSKFNVGETNILEYNKAQLNLLKISKDLELLEIQRNTLFSELTRLNGGIFIDFTDSQFHLPSIPVDFEQWYLSADQNNPVLNWLKQEIEISQKQEKLTRALSLPKLRAGYMSESVVGERFSGITGGLSIPLWGNKNTVKHAKANTLAIESITHDTKIQLYNHLKALHTKAISLQQNIDDYRFTLRSIDNSELLKKAFDKGEISLINYILELSIYFESENKLVELERNLNQTLAELNQYN